MERLFVCGNSRLAPEDLQASTAVDEASASALRNRRKIAGVVGLAQGSTPEEPAAVRSIVGGMGGVLSCLVSTELRVTVSGALLELCRV
jgi:hypothetical protein